MSEYRLSPLAERDLEEIWLYSERTWSADQANRYTGAVIDMIEDLARSPDKGRPAGDIRPGYRKQATGAHFIFYRQAGDCIEIVRILHQRMDVPAHFPAQED